jgi:hypothetical protein
MSEELISEYVDLAAVKGQTDAFLQELGRVKAAYTDLSNSKLNVQLGQGFSQISAAAKQATADSNALINTQNKLLDQKKKEIQVANEKLKQNKLEEQSNQAVIKTLKEELAYYSELEKQKAKGLSQAAAEAKIATELTNEYALLGKALRDQELRYKNLALTQGFESEAAKEALQTALDTRNVLDKLDGNLRNYQRNVGNYKSAFDGLGMSFTQVARELPSLAINTQTFLLAISNNLPMVFDEIGKARNEISALKAQGEEAPSLFSRIAKSAFSLQVGLSVAVTLLTVFGAKLIEGIKSLFGFTDAEEAAAKATERFQKAQLELIKTQKELNQVYADPINGTDRLNQELAIAQALGKSKKEILEIEKKIATERALNAQKPFFEANADGAGSGFTALAEYQKKLLEADIKRTILVQDRNKTEDEEAIKEYDKKIARATTEVDLYKEKTEDQKKIIKEYYDAISGLAVKNAEIVKERDKKEAVKQLQALKELKDTEFERQKIDTERAIKNSEEILSSESESYDKRIAALNQFTNKRLELNTAEGKNQVADKTIETANEIQRLEEEKAGKTAAQRARIDENIRRAKKNLAEQILLIDKQTGDKQIDIFKDNESKFKDITKQAYDKRTEEIQKQAEAEAKALEDARLARRGILKQEYADAVESLNQRSADGLTTTKEYTKERKKIEDKFRLDSLEAEILYTKDVILLMKARGIDVKKELEILHDLEVKFSDAKKGIQDDDLKTTLEFINQLEGYYNTLKGIIESVLDAAAIKRKNQIQEEIDLINKRKESELAANDARIQSDQDRAANATLINSRAKAQQDELERRKKEIDIQRAKAEKALAIFSITLSTAKNVAEAKDPFSKIFALVSGAAQLAIAIATPIPKFRYGKGAGNTYEGPGIVNDGPEREVVEHSDGTFDFPIGKNVLVDLKKDDIVHPSLSKWFVGALGAAHRDSRPRLLPPPGSDPIIDHLTKQTRLLRSIAEKRELTLGSSDAGMVAIWRHGSNENRYVEENTQWNK